MQFDCVFFHICRKFEFEFLISQGSVATRIRWGGYCCMDFVANFIRFPAVQKFWTSVKIWQSYRQLNGGNFFETQCTISSFLIIITRHRASTSTRWHFAFALYCHSNETRAPIANSSNSTQLGAPPTIPPSYTRVRSVVWEWFERQTDTQTHRRAWPLYISRRVLVTRNVIIIIIGLLSFITLRVNRRRREMYTGHGRLCVCLSLAAFAHYCTDPGVTWGMVGVPLVVRCWADMQSVHGFRCYDNIAPNAKCQRVLVLALWFYMQAYFMYYNKCFSVLLLSALYKHSLTCCMSI